MMKKFRDIIDSSWRSNREMKPGYYLETYQVEELRILLDQYTSNSCTIDGIKEWKPRPGLTYYLPYVYDPVHPLTHVYAEQPTNDFINLLLCKTPEEATQLASRMLTIARKWKPIEDHMFYYWDFEQDSVCNADALSSIGELVIPLGNCFPTQQECEEWSEKCGWSK